jgi:hypothetical protein
MHIVPYLYFPRYSLGFNQVKSQLSHIIVSVPLLELDIHFGPSMPLEIVVFSQLPTQLVQYSEFGLKIMQANSSSQFLEAKGDFVIDKNVVEFSPLFMLMCQSKLWIEKSFGK